MQTHDDFPDDILEIAQDISASNFNIKQYKQTQFYRPIKLDKPFQSQNKINNQSQLKKNIPISSQPNTRYDSFNHNKSIGNTLNRSLKFNDTFIHPYKAKNHPKSLFTKSMQKNKQNLRNHMTEHKPNPNNKQISYKITVNNSQNNQIKKRIKAQNKQKKQQFSKGKLKQSSLQSWLNSVLLQFYHDQYFDIKISNCALKKLAIDQNSLVAKGMKQENVIRLYRGLFVFGMGFNQLIGEITQNNKVLKATIWKIYSTILEYCSKGSLQTVIGQIHRNFNIKEVQLTNELAKRQYIIEKNDELNQKKNSQIFKQLKKLREQNVNLLNQKTVLSQQYNATDQAFTQQVALRLKFQTKINEIYGLHRELGLKHQKLFQSLSTSAQQLKRQSQKYFSVIDKISELKSNEQKLKQQIITLKIKSKKQNGQLKELKQQKKNILSLVNKLQYQVKEYQNKLIQIKNKQKLWISQKQTLTSIVQLREKSTKQTHREYQLTLQQNNRLYIAASDQRKVMEQYEKQKKNFNTKIISIVAQNSIQKRKLEDANNKINILQQTISKLKKQNQQILLENQILKGQQARHENYQSNTEKGLQQMHKIHMKNSQQLQQLRKYYNNVDKNMKQKNKNIQKLQNIISYNQEQIQKAKNQIQIGKSQNQILRQKLQQLEKSVSIRKAQLQSQFQNLILKQEKYQNQIKLLTIQSQRMRNQFQIILNDLKNQKFQRNAVNESYHQTLKMIQRKNEEEKQLNVKISMMSGQLEKQKAKYNLLQKSMIKIISEFGINQENMETTLQKQMNIIIDKMMFVHPMIIQDLKAQIIRLSIKNQHLDKQNDLLEIRLKKQIAFRIQQIQRISADFRWNINKTKIQTDRIIEQKMNQLAFQIQNNKTMKVKLTQLQNLSQTYRKKIYEKSTSQRQEVFKYMLEQKKKQLEQSQEQIVRLQDQLLNLQLRFAQSNKDNNQIKPQDIIQHNKNIQQSIRKQLQHQYDLKIRDFQRSFKNQQKKSQKFPQNQFQIYLKDITLQQIIKIKDISPESILQELKMINISLNQTKQPKLLTRDQFYLNQQKKMNQDTKNRKKMTRIIKQAYQYYN